MKTAGVCLLTVLSMAVPSLAATIPIFDGTGGGTTVDSFTGAAGTAGFSFGVSTSLQISGLGVFDVGSDGLLNSHDIGLWNSSGTLLASTTVDNSGNVVSSTSGLGRWVEVDISPLTLGPGTYQVGAFYRNANVIAEDKEIVNASLTGLGGVPYFGYKYQTGGSTISFMTNGLGLTTTLSAMAFTSSVPEPATLGLLVPAVMLGYAVVRRRRLQ